MVIRGTKPESGNKYFNTKSKGGYSTCIVGKPTEKGLNVLANCVGYANGAFNETCGQGKELYNLNCNAENFIERAISRGLSVVQEPVIGGIMVWQKGATLSGKDGAGHVAYVYDKLSPTKVKTSESGYNNKAFWTATREKGNGNWGMSSSYKYRGCIVNPYVEVVKITNTVERDTSKNQLKALETMNVRTGIETTSTSLGTVGAGAIFNWYEEKEGKSSYWYAITEDKSQWIAGVNKNGTKYCEIYRAETTPEPIPVPEPEQPSEWPKSHTVKKGEVLSKIALKYYGNGDYNHYMYIANANGISNPNKIYVGQVLTIPEYKDVNTLSVGDKVQIISSYASSSTSKTAANSAGIGWKREILKIYEGRNYPYQVGNSSGVTGYCKASGLKKL